MKVINTIEELTALLDAKGNLEHEGDLQINCNVPFSAGVNNLNVGGYLDLGGEYLIIEGSLFWSQSHIPAMPEKRYINRVLPHEYQRDHWQERLGMDLSEGCYDHLCKLVLKQVLNLLKDDKWSSTERWMLETLRDSKNPTPEWVAEIHEAKAA